jgi:hypothetical protein
MKFRVNTSGEAYFPDVPADDLGASGNTDLYIQDADGKLGYDSSSIAAKENVRDLDNASWIYNLRCVKYDPIDSSDKDCIGLIAEEVHAAADIPPALISYHHTPITAMRPSPLDGELVETVVGQQRTDQPKCINYSRLVVPLLKEVQRLRIEVDQLKLRN